MTDSKDSGSSVRGTVARVVCVEVFTVAWMVVEALLSIGAGIAAHSFLLVAFGLDTVLELLSASVLSWQFSARLRGSTAERAERA